jgi:hypothetical protein
LDIDGLRVVRVRSGIFKGEVGELVDEGSLFGGWFDEVEGII